jgi:hypothetical protein
VDPRCFAEDPLNEPYLENALLQTFTKRQKEELFEKTKRLIRESIEFRMLPKGPVFPDFKMKFTSFSNADLTWNADHPDENTVQCAETPAVITAEWKTEASQFSAFQIKARKEGFFSVRFINDLNGEEQPLNVLFPGEESYKLVLTGWAETVASKSKGRDPN